MPNPVRIGPLKVNVIDYQSVRRGRRTVTPVPKEVEGKCSTETETESHRRFALGKLPGSCAPHGEASNQNRVAARFNRLGADLAVGKWEHSPVGTDMRNIFSRFSVTGPC